MAYDEGLAQLLRDDLVDAPITEKKMFGGLAFLIGGNMVCGVHKGGAMFRVGRERMAEALVIPGAAQMAMGGRPMTGMVECPPEVLADDSRRTALLSLAFECVRGLPPKADKPARPRSKPA